MVGNGPPVSAWAKACWAEPATSNTVNAEDKRDKVRMRMKQLGKGGVKEIRKLNSLTSQQDTLTSQAIAKRVYARAYLDVAGGFQKD
jgi:hypothetical protein